MEFITREYICSKETFEKARIQQKQLMEWARHYEVYEAEILKENEEYLKTHPEPKNRWSQEYRDWSHARPAYTKIQFAELPKIARYHNIVYSVMRGRIYSQIENKVREHNEPSSWAIKDVLKKYNIDYQKFIEAAEDAKFKS